MIGFEQIQTADELECCTTINHGSYYYTKSTKAMNILEKLG